MDCEICHGTRWKSVIVGGVERVTRCDCWRDLFIEQTLKNSGVDAKFKRAELATFVVRRESQRDALRAAVEFVEGFPVRKKGVLFHGPTGVGKTHLAIGILKEAIRSKGARGFFFETMDLLTKLRDTYNKSVDETELGVLKPILNADLLVLDDLGGGLNDYSPWAKEMLGLVVNTRYNAEKPTIVTTNLKDVDSTERVSMLFQLGVRTRSRLIEMCEWVSIDDADSREVGTDATDKDIDQWRKTSPASPQNLERSRKKTDTLGGLLPSKTKSQARAKLKSHPEQYELNWSGGRAGNK